MKIMRRMKRGGPRPNSGRRPIDPALKRRPFSCTLAPDVDKWVREVWDKGSDGQSLGDVMDLIIRTHPSFGMSPRWFRDKELNASTLVNGPKA